MMLAKKIIALKNIPIRWVLLFVFLVAFVLGLCSMDSGHEWGDDFALYLNQASCWIHGGMEQLAIDNGKNMADSDFVMGPDLYPQGFPMMISLPMRWMDFLGFKGLKIFNFSIFLACVFLIWEWVVSFFGEKKFWALLVLLLVIWHPKFIEAADRLTSDLWFTSLILLFLHFLNREWINAWMKIVLLALIVFLATSTRTNGIFLLPMWFVFEWKRAGIQGVWQWISALLLGSAAGLFALKMGLGHGTIYMDLLLGSGMSKVLGSSSMYLEMLGSYPIWHIATLFKSIGLGALVAIFALFFWFLVVFGIVKYFNRLLPLVIFVFLNIALVFLWPIPQGMRLFFPVLPLLMLMFVLGLRSFISLLIDRGRVPFCKSRFFEFFRIFIQASVCLLFLIQGVATALFYLRRDTNQAFSKSTVALYDFVDNHIERNARISFKKSRLMHFATGSNVVRLCSEYGDSPQLINGEVRPKPLDTCLKILKSKSVKYWVLTKFPVTKSKRSFDYSPLRMRTEIVFESPEFIVAKLH